MNTLDRYIFRKACLMWLGAMVSLVGLVVLAQFFGNVSMFSEFEAQGGSIFLFVVLGIPPILTMVLPFSVCLGILATQALFSRHVETIAMQASGVPDRRIFRPYLLVGLLATVLMGLLAFIISPLAQKQADRIEDIEIRRKGITGSFSQSGCRFQSGDTVYFAEHIDVKEGRMRNITCYRIKDGRLASVIEAREAHWDGSQWTVQGMRTVLLDGPRIREDRSLHSLPLTRVPADLVTVSPQPDVLTITGLRQYLKRLDAQGIHSRALETSYYSRISFACAPLIMCLLVLPFGMRFPRTGGIARGVAVGLVLGLTYWGLHAGMLSAGASGYVRPLLAAWSANVLAFVTGLIMIGRRRGTYG